jgi:hypothetical protein
MDDNQRTKALLFCTSHRNVDLAMGDLSVPDCMNIGSRGDHTGIRTHVLTRLQSNNGEFSYRGV